MEANNRSGFGSALRSVRIYSPHFPYPPTEGAFQVILDQLRSLSTLGLKTELVVWKETQTSLEAKRRQESIQTFPPDVRVIPQYTHRTRESGLGQAIRTTRSLLSEVASPEDYYYPVGREPHVETEADLAIFHFSFAHAWLSSGRRTNARHRVVVFHNLESELFRERASQASSPLLRAIHSTNAQKLARHEAELSSLAEELWFLTPVDQERYLERNPHARSRVRLVPPTFPKSLWESRRASFQSRFPRTEKLVVGLLGGLHFLPNQESASWVIDHLAPLLHAGQFKGEIRIVGKEAPEALNRKAKAFPFIRFEGFIPDLASYWAELSYSLVPQAEGTGSGVRIKLLESLASGVPALTTTEAARRIHPKLRSELRSSPSFWINDDPKLWAEKLLTAQAQEERRKVGDLSMPQWLDGLEVYSFLKE